MYQYNECIKARGFGGDVYMLRLNPEEYVMSELIDLFHECSGNVTVVVNHSCASFFFSSHSEVDQFRVMSELSCRK